MINVLIVEDEPWIRKGIVKSIGWERLGMELAGEAENGGHALEILCEKPADIIVMDMRMPRLNGIELLKELKKLSFQGQIVVLSEFSDYEYMRQAIYANVFEYLLKPVDEAELNATLERAASKIRAKSAQMREQAGAVSGSHNEKAYNELLLPDPETNRAGAQKLAECGEGLSSRFHCAAVMLAWRRRRPGCAAEPMDADTMDYVAADIRLEYAGKHDLRVFRDHQKIGCVVLLFGSDEPAAVRPEGLLAQIGASVRGKHGLSVRFGLGDWQPGLGGIAASCRDACAALRFQHASGQDIVHIGDVQGLEGGGDFECPVDDRKLQALMQSPGKQAVLKLCASAFDEMRKEEYCRIPSVRALALDMMRVLERFCRRQGCDGELQSMYRENLLDIPEELNSLEEIEESALYTIGRLLEAETKRRMMQGHDVIDEIRKYIQANYAEEIDLIHLAQEYHVNYIHLSRLFKGRTGENFTDYLTRVRMEKARELIRKGGLKVKEVAELVGYGNPYYFSSSYKKFFGHTPGETDGK